jgi:hypothetical protein
MIVRPRSARSSGSYCDPSVVKASAAAARFAPDAEAALPSGC